MSLIFGAGRVISTSIALDDAQYPQDHIKLDPDTWNALSGLGHNDTGSSSEDDLKVAVSLAPAQSTASNSNKLSRPNNLIVWAVLDNTISTPCVHPRWAQEYAHIFHSLLEKQHSPITYTLTRTSPICLTEVILIAQSSKALSLARTSSSLFESQSSIVRVGDILHLSQFDQDTYKYRVAVTEPAQQGIVKNSHTLWTVIPGEWDSYQNGVDGLSLDTLSDDDDSSSVSYSDIQSDESSDIDAIDISEDFLAHSLLSSTLSQPKLNGHLPHSDSEPELHLNGVDSKRSEDEDDGATYYGLPLLHPDRTSTSFGKDEDPEARVYVRTSDLGRLGVFSGDWAVVSETASSNTTSKLARIISDDEILKGLPRRTVLASPLFLHNLAQSQVSSSPPYASSSPAIRIYPTPFPSSHSPPIPTAKSVTIARIASPYTTDKKYQPLFLQALKDFLSGPKGTRRILRVGDLIGAGIREADARIINVEDGEGGNDVPNSYISKASTSTAVVFFKVTNIEHDVVSLPIPSEMETSSSNGALEADTYIAATMGELGCWVDSNSTQVIQTGLEHTVVPSVSQHLRISSGVPPLPSDILTSAQNTLMAPYTKLFELVSASLLPSASSYDLHLSILLRGARGIGKRTIAAWVAQTVGMHLFEINCFDIVGETDVQTEGTLRARVERATECSPCIFLLRNLEALAKNTQVLETGKEPAMATILHECLDELQQSWKINGFPVILIATTSEAEKIPLGVLSCFKHEIAFESPAEVERLEILNSLLINELLAPDVNVKSIATQTAALVAGDLVDLVERVRRASVQRARTAVPTAEETDLILAGLVLTAADFDNALGEARASFSESIGAPKIPNVTWDDVGGLASVKDDILDTIQLPLDHPELFADGLKKRSGILLYGPPGTGKTLLAKAVATSCSLNFFSVKGPELLNMYIGESEANVRRVFQRARDAKPCVIFFDELDSVAPKRGNHGDSGGVMDRIVSQLLAELDGMSDGKGGADVFVIGATNRPDLLDSALLRPGRFDRMLYLGVSDTHEAQLNILKALTRKFRLDPELDLHNIAQQCPFNYTGADFYALCSDAMLKSMSRKAEEIDAKIAELNALPPPYAHPQPLTPQYYLAEMATPAETDVLVSKVDFEQALRELVPSVSQGEMEHYREVQKKFANDTINAKESDEEKANEVVGNGYASASLDGDLDASKDGEREDERLDRSDFQGAVQTAPLVSHVNKGKGKARELSMD